MAWVTVLFPYMRENMKSINDMKKGRYRILIAVIIALQLMTAFCFCTQKQGFHYDENYSYYSSNVTSGLVPTDRYWMDTNEIKNEFMVLKGEGFNYGTVKLMQTFDVHPPLYYFVLHTVCSFTPGVFSKWQGLSVNLLFFVLALIMLVKIADIVSNGDRFVTLATLLLFGFSPSVFSGITFIRMYMMLTFLCFCGLYIHLKGFDKKNRTITGFYLPVFLTSYLGFMTHYYYVVFLFFIAAYMCLYLFFKKETRKQAFIYGACVVAALLLEVVTYRACLGHIFKGYRGTEAIGAFIDPGNLMDRASMFIGLLNDYLLCNSFYLLLLILMLLFLTYMMLKKRGYYKKTDSEESLQTETEAATDLNVTTGKETDDAAINKQRIYMCLMVTLGYFAVVMKTALMQAEEAIRYEMPVYGTVILLIVIGIVSFTNKLGKKEEKKEKTIACAILFAVAIVLNLVGLANNKVQFIYPEAVDAYEWASARKDKPVVYLYNGDDYWMIWDNAEELMEYDKIFFIDICNDELWDDEIIDEADELIVYAARDDRAEEFLKDICYKNGAPAAVKQRELKYADVYVVR